MIKDQTGENNAILTSLDGEGDEGGGGESLLASSISAIVETCDIVDSARNKTFFFLREASGLAATTGLLPTVLELVGFK